MKINAYKLNILQLISCHEVRIVLKPSCSDLYNDDTGEIHKPLVILQWVVFCVAITVFIASSALLVFGVFYVSYILFAYRFKIKIPLIQDQDAIIE